MPVPVLDLQHAIRQLAEQRPGGSVHLVRGVEGGSVGGGLMGGGSLGDGSAGGGSAGGGSMGAVVGGERPAGPDGLALFGLGRREGWRCLSL